MASKEEVAQLKKTVQELRKGQLDILIRLEVAKYFLAVGYEYQNTFYSQM